VSLEQGDEALAHHAGGPEDSHAQCVHVAVLSEVMVAPQNKTRR
jgi:hypothetical protein